MRFVPAVKELPEILTGRGAIAVRRLEFGLFENQFDAKKFAANDNRPEEYNIGRVAVAQTSVFTFPEEIPECIGKRPEAVEQLAGIGARSGATGV